MTSDQNLFLLVVKVFVDAIGRGINKVFSKVDLMSIIAVSWLIFMLIIAAAFYQFASSPDRRVVDHCLALDTNAFARGVKFNYRECVDSKK